MNYNKALNNITLSCVSKDELGTIKFFYMNINKPFSIKRSGL